MAVAHSKFSIHLHSVTDDTLSPSAIRVSILTVAILYVIILSLCIGRECGEIS